MSDCDCSRKMTKDRQALLIRLRRSLCTVPGTAATRTATTTSKNNWFYEKNNSSARTSRFLVQFFDVHCTPNESTFRVGRKHRTVSFSLNLLLNLSVRIPLRLVFHQRRSQSRSHNQKRRSYDLVFRSLTFRL